MSKGRRILPTGRNEKDQFISLSYSMLKSDAWRSLSGSSLKVLMELVTRCHGFNNGRVCLSYDDGAKKLKMGKATIGRAFDELQVKGFIKLVKLGHWYGRKATEWTLTIKPLGGMPATNDWKYWRRPIPEKTKVGFNTEHICP